MFVFVSVSIVRCAFSRRPIRITVEADGPPAAFHWQGRRHAVGRWWGPERIETGWWRGGIVRRDYYRVETTTGRRVWLFRDLSRRRLVPARELRVTFRFATLRRSVRISHASAKRRET